MRWPSSATVLLVSRDPHVIRAVRRTVSRMGRSLDVAGSLPEARRYEAARRYDLVLIQADAPDTGVRQHLAERRAFGFGPPVIAVAARGSIEGALCALRAGARDYICLHTDHGGSLAESLRRAAAEREAAPAAWRTQEGAVEDFVTKDHRMLEVFEVLGAVAHSRVTVLIEGESGTGKTFVARMLHRASSHRNGAFVEVNCGALSESLLESELFGHARGAFTSAGTERAGKFEAANGGTLLLDDVANASLRLQAKLLRVVDRGEFERLGETRTRRTDVRLVVASNRPLRERVDQGLFREDLYHRLNRVRLVIPPLRDRVGDIVPLARHFLRVLAKRYGRRVSEISPEALDRLVHYRWPGNVRELRNVIEHGVLLARDGMIVLESLPARVVQATEAGGRARACISQANSLKEVLAERERRCILEALRLAGWNKQEAAARLRISRSTLYKKLKEHGLAGAEEPKGGILARRAGRA